MPTQKDLKANTASETEVSDTLCSRPVIEKEADIRFVPCSPISDQSRGYLKAT